MRKKRDIRRGRTISEAGATLQWDKQRGSFAPRANPAHTARIRTTIVRDVARTEIAAKNHSPGAPPPLAPPAPVVGTDPLDELTQDPEDKLLLDDELPGIDPPDELEELEDELLDDELLDDELELLLDDELLELDRPGKATLPAARMAPACVFMKSFPSV